MNPPYSPQTPPSPNSVYLPIPKAAGRYRLIGFGIVLPLLILIWVILSLLQQQSFVFDLRWMLALHHYASPVRNDLAVALAALGGLPIATVVAGLLCLGVYIRKRGQARRQWLWFLGSVCLGAVIIGWSLKLGLGRPRPELWPRLVQDYGASFPSGHSLYAAVLAYVGVLLSWQTRWRRLVICLSLLWVLLMGLSRVYLGVHYPSDVLGGWLLGLLWVSLVYVGWGIYFDPQRHPDGGR